MRLTAISAVVQQMNLKSLQGKSHMLARFCPWTKVRKLFHLHLQIEY
ncbi:hypothetical protein [Ruminococcus sp.]